MSSFLTVKIPSRSFLLWKSANIPNYSPAPGRPSPEAEFRQEARAELTSVQAALERVLGKLSSKEIGEFGLVNAITLAPQSKSIGTVPADVAESANWTINATHKDLAPLTENASSLDSYKRGPCIYQVALARFPFSEGQNNVVVDLYLEKLPAEDVRMKLIQLVLEAVDAAHAPAAAKDPSTFYAAPVALKKSKKWDNIEVAGDVFIASGNRLARGTLTKDTEVQSLTYAKHTSLVFWKNGKVFEGTLAKSASVKGKTFLAGTVIRFSDSGEPL